MCESEFIMAESSRSSSDVAASSTSSDLHQKRGVGYSSRFRVSDDNLPPGWRCERKSAKYTVWFDDRGNRYKSSVEVERALKERGLHHRSQFSDDETETETGGETSEYEPSPVKKPREEPDM